MAEMTVNGYAMSYVEAGSGEPLVLVHGSLLDQRYWRPQMDVFGQKFRTLAVSLRHYWPATWDGKGDDFTIAQHVADVLQFIRGLGAGQVRLIGHSRGGHIAFRVAEQAPELLRAVVLAEPGGELDETLGGAPQTGVMGPQAQMFAEAAELIRAGHIDDGLRVVTDGSGGPGAWDRRPETGKNVSRDNANTMLGQINERRPPFSRASAESIRVPTLLIAGANTRPNFVAVMDALEKTIPGARRASVPNAGHSMSLENPAAFNAAVLDFFATP